MTRFDIARLRLQNLRLVGSPLETGDEVVRWLGAVQAQDYSGAKWGVAQRTAGATDGDLDRLFDAGAILRTHVMRPTWHFVAPEAIRWLLALTAPRVHAVNAYYYRKFELDEEVFARGRALLEHALAGGRQLTRADVVRVLEAGGIVASGLRLAYLLMAAELDGVICSGALRGKQHTYALLDERVPLARSVAREEALAELARRFFTSHGPATVQDFSWWSGLTVADAKAGVELNTSVLQQERVEDKTFWIDGTGSLPGETRLTMHLLPNYDEHLIAYRDHGALLDPGAGEVGSDHEAVQAHIIARNGRVVGGWRRAFEKREVKVTTNLLLDLNEDERAQLGIAAERFGGFLGLPVRVV